MCTLYEKLWLYSKKSQCESPVRLKEHIKVMKNEHWIIHGSWINLNLKLLNYWVNVGYELNAKAHENV